MQYMRKSFTIPPPRSTGGCCEACVYGRGEHAAWCEKYVGHVRPRGLVDQGPPVREKTADLRAVAVSLISV